jgi:ribose 5-phosphate isomerase A
MNGQPPDNAKRNAGIHAAGMVEDGMVLGLGTGSTVLYAMQEISDRIRDGLSVSGIPTSFQAAIRARELGIPLTTLDDHPHPDLAIDGADQVDPKLRLIKGRGAALMREKCIAAATKRFIVVIDREKVVNALSAPVPIEVLPFAVRPVAESLEALGGVAVLREGIRKDGPVITDNGNMILDCSFGTISKPGELELAVISIPGVLSCGIFSSFTGKTTVIVGEDQGAGILQ